MFRKKTAALFTAAAMTVMNVPEVCFTVSAENEALTLAVETMNSSAGRGEFILTPSVTSVETGGTVTVSLSLGSNPGINGMLVNILYDQAAFEFRSYSYYPKFFWGSDSDVQKLSDEDITPGRIPLMWTDAAKTDSSGNARNFTDTGEIIALTFSVKEGAAPGAHSFSVDFAEEDVFRTAGTTEAPGGFVPVPFDTVGCKVMVGTALTSSNTTVSLGSYNAVYDGSGKKPVPVVKYGGQLLTEGTDYTVSYSDNVNAGNASVYITGTGKYAGTVSKTFPISPASLDNAAVSLSPTSCDYDGTAHTPQVSVSCGGTALRNGTDFTVTYSDNTDPGTATVTIAGKGNYAGTIYRYFHIIEQQKLVSLEDAVMTVSSPTMTYDGTPRKPKAVVKVGNTVLTEGVDYKLSYQANVNVGDALVTAEGMGKYTDSISAYFKIVPKNLSAVLVKLSAYSFDYDGAPIFPDVTVTDNGTVLKEDTDYVLKFTNNSSVGTGTVTVTGKGNYTGSRTENFTIGKRNISSCEITLPSKSYVYDGSEKEPVPTVFYSDGETLKEGVDYRLSYAANVNAGTAVLTVTGLGKYSGSVITNFEILPKQLNGATLSFSPASFVYDGTAKYPEVTVKLGGRELVEDTDYSVTFSSNTGVGIASAEIEGKGNYSGTLSGGFRIFGKSLTDDDVTLDQTTFVYDGTEKKPVPTVKSGSATLREGVDYTVSYSDNINAGTALLTVTGRGGYSGTVRRSFTISPIPISSGKVTVEPTTYVFDGKAKTPAVTVTLNGAVLREGVDFSKTYSRNTGVGTATVNITGKGNYGGTLKGYFTIEEEGNSVFSLTSAETSLKAGQTFTVTLSFDRNPGVNGIVFDVNFDPTVFKLNRKKVAAEFFTGSPHKVECNNVGDGDLRVLWASATVVDNDGKDIVYYDEGDLLTMVFTVLTDAQPGSYDISIPAESVQVVRSLGTVDEPFKNENVQAALHGCTVQVNGLRQISLAEAEIDQSDMIYDGTAKTPSVTVIDEGRTLTENVDYQLSYGNNIKAGKAFVTVTGIGSYTGSFSRQFTIRPKSITDTDIVLPRTSAVYTGSEIKIGVIVKDGGRALVSGTDYTVSYSSNINAGTAEITVIGSGNYTGSVVREFTVSPKSISEAEIKLGQTKFTYTGSEIKPAATVKLDGAALVSGTDYTVTYSNNVNPGTATVTITGKGNYTGTVTAKFFIESDREFMYGDLNDNGIVNIDDLLLMQKYVAGWKIKVNERAADVVPDGKIDSKDLVLMQKYVAGWKVTLG